MFSYHHPVVQADLERISSANFMPYRKKRVLVTGATGMLATYLIFSFLYMNEKHGLQTDVVGLARHREKAERRFGDLLERPDFSLLVQDVTEPISDERGYDAIFHFAGNASAAAILSDPVDIILSNVVGTKNVLELAAEHRGTKVFFASTREVYGKTGAGLLREDTLGVLDPLSTRSCYPESKRMAENLCAVFHDRTGSPVCIARIAHVYGPGMQLYHDGRIMADLIGNAVKGEDIVLRSDGSARRAFCYLSDAISGILLAMNHTEELELYNIANETEEISVRELAELIALEKPGLKVRFELPAEAMKKAYFNVPRVKLSTSKLEGLGWAPQISLREGIRNTLGSAL